MPYKTTPRLTTVLDQYLKTRGAYCAPSTLMNDRSILRRFVEGVGDPQAHLLSTAACEDWFAIEAGRQKATSYNKCRSRVLGFTSFLMRRRYLDVDVMGEVRPKRTQSEQRLQLSRAQLVALIETTENPRDRGMIATSCNTGLRAGDLTSLKVGDALLEEGLLRVTIQKTKDTDLLPITQELAVELRRWLTWYAERLAVTGLRLHGDYFLFPALGHCNVRRAGRMEQYGDPQPYRQLRHPARVVQRGLVRIGVDETRMQGFHTIRRSVGRAVFEQAAAEGHDGALRLTAALLGHKSTATTEIYLGINHDRVKRNELLKGRSFLGGAQEARVRAIRGATG